jgi:hypothetical protein
MRNIRIKKACRALRLAFFARLAAHILLAHTARFLSLRSGRICAVAALTG